MTDSRSTERVRHDRTTLVAMRDLTASLEGTNLRLTALDQAAKQIEGVARDRDVLVRREAGRDRVQRRFILAIEGALRSASVTSRAGKLHLAHGGEIRGAGGPRDDAIPALLSNGEFVVNARATARHRALLLAINGEVTQPSLKSSSGRIRLAQGGDAVGNPYALKPLTIRRHPRLRVGVGNVEDNKARLAHEMSKVGLNEGEQQEIFGQVEAESRFIARPENTNYSPEKLVSTFKRYVHGIEDARALIAQGPEAIAERIYGGRMGNVHPGDGFRYRGRGFIQLTGRDGYAEMDRKLKLHGALLANPDLADDPSIAAQIAAQYFRSRSANILGPGKGRYDLSTPEGATKATGPATPNAVQIRGANAARYRGKMGAYAARGAALTTQGSAVHPVDGANGASPHFARGGEVHGSGGPKEDRVLARLSSGEFVVNAGATARNRRVLEAINSSDSLPKYAEGETTLADIAGYKRVNSPSYELKHKKKSHPPLFITDEPMPQGDGQIDPQSVRSILYRGESQGGNPGIYNFRIVKKGTKKHPKDRVIYQPGVFTDYNSLDIGSLQALGDFGVVFAAGKYQIVPETLRAAVKSLHLGPGEKFTSGLQDRIFTDFLAGKARPALNAYITGVSDNLDAAHRAIAHEWVSIAYKHRSFGPPPNKALIDEEVALATLRHTRELFLKFQSEGYDATTARRAALLGLKNINNILPHEAIKPDQHIELEERLRGKKRYNNDPISGPSVALSQKFNRGGAVRGSGGPHDDRVLARLSPGEFVVNADAVRRHRVLIEAINAGTIHLPGFSKGGIVPAQDQGPGTMGTGPDTSDVLIFPRSPTPLGYTGEGFDGKTPAIMRGFMDRYSLERWRAAGIVGNLGHESRGFTKYQEANPKRGRGGAGWPQWTGPRRRAFEAWTAARGLDPTSDEASWRYMTEGDPETDRAIAAVKRATNLHGAVQAWHDAYEKSGDTDPRTGRVLVPHNWNSRKRYSDRANTMGPAPEMRRFQSDPLPPDHHADASPALGADSSIGAVLPVGERVISVMASLTDKVLRDAERAVLPPIRSAAAPDATPRGSVGSASLDLDHSGLREAIHHVRTLKAELASLGTATVDVRHSGFGTRGEHAPGAVRAALNGNFGSDGQAFT